MSELIAFFLMRSSIFMNLSHRNSPNTKKNGISRSVGLSKAQKWPTGKEFHLNDSRDEPVAPAREFVFVCNINLQTLESIMPNLTARNGVTRLPLSRLLRLSSNALSLS